MKPLEHLWKPIFRHPLTWVAGLVVVAGEAWFVHRFHPPVELLAASLGVGALALVLWPVLLVRSENFVALLYRLSEQVRRSHKAILTECNNVFAHELEHEEPADAIGTRLGTLDGSRDAEAHFDFFSTFVENDYRLTNYELIYKTPSGAARAVRVSLTGIVQDGYLHRFWGAALGLMAPTLAVAP